MSENLRSLPTVEDGEFVIQFNDHGEPDDFGRRGFFAYWLANNAGRGCDEHGVRGQVFFTDLVKFVRDAHRRGYTVRYLHNGTEW